MVWTVFHEGPVSVHACECVRAESDFPHGQDGLEHAATRFMGSTGSQAVRVSAILGDARQHIKSFLFSEGQADRYLPQASVCRSKATHDQAAQSICCAHGNTHGMCLSPAMCQIQETAEMS